MSQSSVDLGFTEPDHQPWQLQSYQFPSKIGGKPAWLALENLPKAQDTACDICGAPLSFLCQVYAPYEDDDANFHRTLFIFVCRKEECCQKNNSGCFKAFRSSLSRQNKFYPFEPPQEAENPDFGLTLAKFTRLCRVCGGIGTAVCAKCGMAAYCTQKHQVLDWKEGGHKQACGTTSEIISKVSSSILFPESLLVIEAEERSDKAEVNEEAELRNLENLRLQGRAGNMSDVSEAELENFAGAETDKTFLKFKERIGDNAGQVLRYDKGGQPLWIADSPTPGEVPKCEGCGGERQFEFQIMPQMLVDLNEGALDWGVVAVYTCKKSCTSDGYRREFVFKQDVSS